MATVLTKGIIISKVAHKESDCLYIIYTKKLGKVSAIVKGGQKILSKLCGHMEPLSVVNLMLARGKGFYRVASAQVKLNSYNLASNLQKNFIANYFIEALDHLTEYNYSNESLFKIVDSFLMNLSERDNKKDMIILLNQSLFDLLTSTGYQPKIKSSSQKKLIQSFNKVIVEASEREMKSFSFVLKCFSS